MAEEETVDKVKLKPEFGSDTRFQQSICGYCTAQNFFPIFFRFWPMVLISASITFHRQFFPLMTDHHSMDSFPQTASHCRILYILKL